MVVLDACDDDSDGLAGRFGADVHFVTVDAGNVGAARAAGFTYLRSLCDADTPTWYATTDADSRVDPDWLIRQLSADADMVLGVVRVSDWRRIPAAAVRRYLRAYHATHGAAATTTCTAPTWDSAPTPTGSLGGFRPWPPARTSNWSNASRPPATGCTATPGCR